MPTSIPPAQGLYDPAFEHDACGVAFVVDMHGRRSHHLVEQGITALVHLDHRGASGAEKNTGDGAGRGVAGAGRCQREAQYDAGTGRIVLDVYLDTVQPGYRLDQAQPKAAAGC